MDPAGGGGRATYAPVASRIGAVGVAVFALWWAIELAVAGQATRLVRTLPGLLLVCLVAYAVFWRPAVHVDDDDVILRNIVRDVRVPWGALTGLDTRFALTLITDSRRYQSWAAAAPGRPGLHTRGLFDRRIRAPHAGGAGGPGEAGHDVPDAGRRDAPDPRWFGGVSRAERSSAALTSDSGAAAFLVEQRWARWQTAHDASRSRLPAAGDEPASQVQITWNVPLLAATVVLLVAAGLVFVPAG